NRVEISGQTLRANHHLVARRSIELVKQRVLLVADRSGDRFAVADEYVAAFACLLLRRRSGHSARVGDAALTLSRHPHSGFKTLARTKFAAGLQNLFASDVDRQ